MQKKPWKKSKKLWGANHKMKRLTEKLAGVPFRYVLKDHKIDTRDFGTHEAFFDYNVAMQRLGELEDGLVPNPIDNWTEEDGECLWWCFPIEEAPYVGSPLCEDFPSYVTHFTRLFEPIEGGKQ